MTKSKIFLYRQNTMNNSKRFLSFFPAHPLRQSDGYLFMKWTIADYAACITTQQDPLCMHTTN